MPSLFVPRESRAGETRVAAVPETVKRFLKAGLEVQVEAGAGAGARIPDRLFEEAGAVLVDRSAFAAADLVAKVQPPTEEECDLLRADAVLVSFGWPASNADLVRHARERGISWLAMDLVPRISRAQSMDALSSQATIAGYKAMLLAASHMPVIQIPGRALHLGTNHHHRVGFPTIAGTLGEHQHKRRVRLSQRGVGRGAQDPAAQRCILMDQERDEVTPAFPGFRQNLHWEMSRHDRWLRLHSP